jgi:hypothetical protein
VASYIYGNFKLGQLNGASFIDFDTDAIHVALVNSAYVANASAQDTHDFFNDVAVSEVTGSAYVSGGQSLLSKTVTLDTANDRVDFDAADALRSNSTITAYGAVLYKRVGTTDSVSPVIALIDFGGVQTSSAGAFTIQWSTAGILRLA